MPNYHLPLQADTIYHLFNRAVGNEKLFRSSENYLYFLKKLKLHILPVAEVYVYSLLPNHFHLMVRIKSAAELITHFETKKKKIYNSYQHDLPDFVMEQFSNWLNGYSKAYNKMYKRMGSLFMDYMKRTEAIDDSSITSFIFYIHKNAVHHGLKKNMGEWPFDSYPIILSDKPTDLKRAEVIEWFGSLKYFIDFHSQPVELKLFDIDKYLHL